MVGKTREVGGKDWSEEGPSQGTPDIDGSHQKQGRESPLEPLEGAWRCWYLDFGPPVSRTIREEILLFKPPGLR